MAYKKQIYEKYKNDKGNYKYMYDEVDEEQVTLMNIPSPMESTMCFYTDARGDCVGNTHRNEVLSNDRRCPAEEKVNFMKQLGLTEAGVPENKRSSFTPNVRDTIEYHDLLPFSDKRNPDRSVQFKKNSKNGFERNLDGKLRKVGKSTKNRHTVIATTSDIDLTKHSNTEKRTSKTRAKVASVKSSTVNINLDPPSDMYIRRKASVAARLKMREQLQSDENEHQDCKQFPTSHTPSVPVNIKRHAAILARMKLRTHNDEPRVNEDLYKYAIQNNCLANFYKSTKPTRTQKRKRGNDKQISGSSDNSVIMSPLLKNESRIDRHMSSADAKATNCQILYTVEEQKMSLHPVDQTDKGKESYEEGREKVIISKKPNETEADEHLKSGGLEKIIIKTEPEQRSTKIQNIQKVIPSDKLKIKTESTGDVTNIVRQEKTGCIKSKPASQALEEQIDIGQEVVDVAEPTHQIKLKTVQIRLMKTARVKIIRDVIKQWRTKNLKKQTDGDVNTKPHQQGKSRSKRLKIEQKELKQKESRIDTYNVTDESRGSSSAHCYHPAYNMGDFKYKPVVNDVDLHPDETKRSSLTSGDVHCHGCQIPGCLPETNDMTFNKTAAAPDGSDKMPLLHPYESEPCSKDDVEPPMHTSTDNKNTNGRCSNLELTRKRFSELIAYQGRWNAIANKCRHTF
ncbi:uncharacterized protein [Antedon mediterranea]|uniref:uncharacterized protein n=1 Tax=Antedon mediterranea TaxID=105859 RepID=UPI003AF75E92